MQNRIDSTAGVNGHVPEAAKPAKGKKAKKPAQPKPVTPKPARHNDHLTRYAYAGVALMAALSALLNGHANSLGATIPWAGWGMGLTIPAIILLLGKVAGLLWKRGQHRLAYLTAGAGTGLLLLSVWHCATSISLLTGSPLILAAPMAVAIDVGFVACEVAALVE
jgi:hypothetical protein